LDDTSEASPLFSHVTQLLELLKKQDYFIAVATGKGRRGLDKVLGDTALQHYFDVTRCADETFSKPNPQMINEIMDFVGVQANETLMIGDTEYDLNMANNAGCDSIGILHGVHDEDRLRECAPIEIFQNITELHCWVQDQHTHSE
jgi:phosphoglycolate phosphatase